MVQSPSWEANWFAASQEIPRISRNPKVHHRTHKRPPPVYIMGQPNPVHIPTSHLLEIHLNIIHPSRPRSPQWSPSLRFPHQDPIPPSPHPYAPYAQPISFFSILWPIAQHWTAQLSHTIHSASSQNLHCKAHCYLNLSSCLNQGSNIFPLSSPAKKKKKIS